LPHTGSMRGRDKECASLSENNTAVLKCPAPAWPETIAVASIGYNPATTSGLNIYQFYKNVDFVSSFLLSSYKILKIDYTFI
jgi:hypothetical protein